MLDDEKSTVEAKHKISRIYHMADKLFRDEFKWIFTRSRLEFRDWLNSKTQLNEDHIKDRDKALDRWLDALQWLYKKVHKR